MSDHLGLLCRGPLSTTARARKAELYATGYDEAGEWVDAANRGIPEGQPYVHFVERRDWKGINMLIAHWSTGELKPMIPQPLCGYDFREQSQAGPFNGERQEYTCPKCGTIAVIIPAQAEKGE